MLEMLSSNVEPEHIEYSVFKNRVIKFWHFLSMKQLGDPTIADTANKYYSTVGGARDYIDYCIMRYCQLTPDGKFIIKDKAKALGYVKDIDLFALGISIHKFMNLQGTYQAPIALAKMIGTCISGDYIPTEAPPLLPKTFSLPITKELEDVSSDIAQQASAVSPAAAAAATDIRKTIKIEYIVNSSPRKALIKDANGIGATVERLVRSDANGDYVMWKGGKVYI
jgi:hypothetical protein